MARHEKGLPTPRSVRSPHSPTPPTRSSLRKRQRLIRILQQDRGTVHKRTRKFDQISVTTSPKALPDKAFVKCLSEVAGPLFGAQAPDVLGAQRGGTGGHTTPAEYARMAIAYVVHTSLGWRATRVGDALDRTRYAARHAFMTVEDMRENPDFDRRIAVLEAAASVIAADHIT